MRMIDPPSRISGRALWTVKTAPLSLTPKTRLKACRGAQAARSRPAPDQPRRGRLSGLGCSAATVRVRRRRSACWTADRWREKILPAPRRASLQASAVTCSAPTFAALSSRRLRGSAPCSGSTKLYRPGTLRERGPASQAIYRRGERAILRATQAFQALSLIFLQLEEHSALAARGSAVGNLLGTDIEQDCRIGKKMLNLLLTTRHGWIASPRRDPIFPPGAWVPRGRRADATAALTKPARPRRKCEGPPQ